MDKCINYQIKLISKCYKKHITGFLCFQRFQAPYKLSTIHFNYQIEFATYYNILTAKKIPIETRATLYFSRKVTTYTTVFSNCIFISLFTLKNKRVHNA